MPEGIKVRAMNNSIQCKLTYTDSNGKKRVTGKTLGFPENGHGYDIEVVKSFLRDVEDEYNEFYNQN